LIFKNSMSKTKIGTGKAQGLVATVPGKRGGRKERHNENMNANENRRLLSIGAVFPPGAEIGTRHERKHE
jgi:hypothetical protein